MEPKCINCHFLAKRVVRQGLPVSEAVTRNEREKMCASNGQLEDVDFFHCHMKVWDEKVDLGIKDRKQNIIEKNRAGECFYFDYRPNLSFETAAQMQKTKKVPRFETLTLLGERVWLIWIISALVLTFSVVYVHLKTQ